MLKKLILIIICVNNLVAMEEYQKAGCAPNLFTLLPSELKLHILSFYIYRDSIDSQFREKHDEACFDILIEEIRQHQLVNKEFKLLLNDRDFLKNLIAHAKQKFNKEEIEVLSRLGTSGSIAWLKSNKIENKGRASPCQEAYELAFNICQKEKLSKSDYVILKSLLAAGLDINKKEFTKRDNLNREMLNKGYTCLMYCAQMGHLRLISEIMKFSKADLNITNMYGWNILMCAVQARNKEVAQLLLEKKANPNFKKNVGHAETALSLAIANGDEEMVKMLLANKSDPNLKVLHNDQTPLHIAVENNNETIVKLLLSYGANPYIKNSFGQTSIALAKSKNAKLINLFLEHNKFK